jgi:L-2,4-diaminobutyrate decarboxylase
MKSDKIYRRIKRLFPLNPASTSSIQRQKEIKKVLRDKSKDSLTRYDGECDINEANRLLGKYGNISERGEQSEVVLKEMATDLFSGVPRWRSPHMFYNVCTATNIASAAMYAAVLEENVHGVNDVLAGMTLVGERAVSDIMSKLAGIPHGYGIFTFGGTGTNLYGMKLGIKKCSPESTFSGLKGDIKILLAEDAHFCHAVDVDWLGIGLHNAERIRANNDRSSNIKDAEEKARNILKSGYKLAAFVPNGGTTYSHTIDDVEDFVDLRDRLIKEFGLSYKPHVHVDAVIGWSWLVFSGYDFRKNIMDIPKETLEAIEEQYHKIAKVKLADSWGIDFHKGIGSVPAVSSMIMLNRAEEAVLLSKKGVSKIETHQLAGRISSLSPVDFTLETTKSAGAPLAALAAFRTLGLDGFRRTLVALTEASFLFRKLLKTEKGIIVLGEKNLGFVSMLQILPPHISAKSAHQYSSQELQEINTYTLRFFDWDKKTRVDKGHEIEYSFTSSFYKNRMGISIAALKFYPTSPHVNKRIITALAHTLIKQKNLFDEKHRTS